MSTTHDTYRPVNVSNDVTELYQPSWVKMDRQVNSTDIPSLNPYPFLNWKLKVLRFNAYFKESCVESGLE